MTVYFSLLMNSFANSLRSSQLHKSMTMPLMSIAAVRIIWNKAASSQLNSPKKDSTLFKSIILLRESLKITINPITNIQIFLLNLALWLIKVIWNALFLFLLIQEHCFTRILLSLELIYVMFELTSIRDSKKISS